jgi:hypothetical protein
MHDYDITCETDGDMALLVAPFAGLEPNDVIATRRVAQDAISTLSDSISIRC